jgi:uncharacterized membrane protein YcaP (DUF421 family)
VGIESAVRDSLFALVTELLPVIGHTLAIYVFLILGFSLIGRRQISQITYVELAIVMILGSAVETAMVAGDTGLIAGLASASTLLVANRLLAILVTRSRWLRRRLIGGPLILVHDGAFVPENLRRVGLTEADVLEAMRERGFGGPAGVRYAIFEVDGSTSVVPSAVPPRLQAKPPGGTA